MDMVEKSYISAPSVLIPPDTLFISQKTLDLCVPASRWQGQRTMKKFLVKFLTKRFVARGPRQTGSQVRCVRERKEEER